MLIFRSDAARVNTRAELARLMSAAQALDTSTERPAAVLTLLIDLGMFEAGVLDELFADADSAPPLTAHLRAASVEVAAVWLESRQGQSAGAGRINSRLARLAALSLPHTLTLRVPEGYAYYGVFPDSYAASAERLVEDLRPARAFVIGVRSIGTSLSAVVAAALHRGGCETHTRTVRPRGHPFARQLRLDESMTAVLGKEASQGATFVVVDEGPGLSGSSFASVSDALRALHIPPERIVLFPSWIPDAGALREGPARQTWSAHRKYSTDAAAAGVTPERIFSVSEPAVDFSAGAWRSTVYPPEAAWPAVQPHHERWKTYLPGSRRLLKFVGLGRIGDAAYQRAAGLASLGMGVPPRALRQGFIDVPFVDGTPLTNCDDDETAATIGTYIGRVAAAFAQSEPMGSEPLFEMIATNVRELLPHQAADPAQALQGWRRAVEGAPRAAIDGRMLAHEWIRSGPTVIKVDALDHHRDHFYPGIQSPAWDLAGASIELDMPPRAVRAMLDAFERASGDRSSRELLPFFHLAYAAFRGGYAAMAAASLDGTPEAQRWRAALPRYTSRLTAIPSAP